METSVSKVDEAKAIKAAKDKEYDLLFGALLANQVVADTGKEKSEIDVIIRKQESGKANYEMLVNQIPSSEE